MSSQVFSKHAHSSAHACGLLDLLYVGTFQSIHWTFFSKFIILSFFKFLGSFLLALTSCTTSGNCSIEQLVMNIFFKHSENRPDHTKQSLGENK